MCRDFDKVKAGAEGDAASSSCRQFPVAIPRILQWDLIAGDGDGGNNANGRGGRPFAPARAGGTSSAFWLFRTFLGCRSRVGVNVEASCPEGATSCLKELANLAGTPGGTLAFRRRTLGALRVSVFAVVPGAFPDDQNSRQVPRGQLVSLFGPPPGERDWPRLAGTGVVPCLGDCCRLPAPLPRPRASPPRGARRKSGGPGMSAITAWGAGGGAWAVTGLGLEALVQGQQTHVFRAP